MTLHGDYSQRGPSSISAGDDHISQDRWFTGIDVMDARRSGSLGRSFLVFWGGRAIFAEKAGGQCFMISHRLSSFPQAPSETGRTFTAGDGSL